MQHCILADRFKTALSHFTVDGVSESSDMHTVLSPIQAQLELIQQYLCSLIC